MKTFFISIITLLFFSSGLQAEVVTGTFQTEKSDEGNYLHVKFGACSKDKSKTCGTINGSFTSNGSKNKNIETCLKPLKANRNDSRIYLEYFCIVLECF